MATFGKNVEIFQQIAAGNLQALRDLVAFTTQLVEKPLPSVTPADLRKLHVQSPTEASPRVNGEML